MKNFAAFFSFLFAYLLYLYIVGRYLISEGESIFSIALYSTILVILIISFWGVAVFVKLLIKGNKNPKDRKSKVHFTKSEVAEKKDKTDVKRRQFLKLIGSLGLSFFFFSLFGKKAQALQFGGTGIPDPIGVEPLGNAQTTGSTTLTSADTWYQVPSSNQTNRVFIVLHNRSGNDMYWTFDNTVNASTGGMLFPSGGNLMLDAGNAVNVYARCGTAGQVCWYAESQSQ